MEEVLGVDVESDVADEHDATLPAGDLHRGVDDLGRVGAGADDGGVGAVLVGVVRDPPPPLRIAGVQDQRRAEAWASVTRPGADVDADHDAAGRPSDLGAQLADEAEAVDDDGLAELELGPAQRLDGDASDGHEGCVA